MARRAVLDSAFESRDAPRRALIRAGGIAALAVGAAYLVITVIYSVIGLVPEDTGEAWLTYIAANSGAWWGIVGLSALTDLLFFPLASALYVALRDVNRNGMLAGAGLLALFAVIDLAVTQLGFAGLIVLSGDYSAAAADAERAAAVAAASFPVAVFRSTLFAAYVIGIPAVGIGIVGMVMRDGAFGTLTAWTGILVGVLGIVSVVTPAAWAPAPYLPILTSVLTLVWIVLVGWRLVRLAGAEPSG